MTDDIRPESGEVVSLDEFRALLRPETVEPPATERTPYAPVDYASYNMARSMLEVLNGGTTDKLVIVQRVTTEPQRVFYVKQWGNWFAVDQNRDDVESITVALENQDEITEARLHAPLRRFYLLSLVAHRVLERNEKIDRNAMISAPKIDEAEIELDTEERWLSVNTWRAAAGLGVIAVGRQRPQLRREIRTHLRNVLSERWHYMLSRQRLSELLGRLTPEQTMSLTPDISHHFLGICNPLNQLEVSKILDTESHPTS
jgi:hypothetical protein